LLLPRFPNSVYIVCFALPGLLSLGSCTASPQTVRATVPANAVVIDPQGAAVALAQIEVSRPGADGAPAESEADGAGVFRRAG
jgi:hypothetical protein